MITPSNFEIRAVFYLPEHGKLWGWATKAHPSDRRYTWHQHSWCWWCVIGKSITVKKHVFNAGRMRMLESRKQSNGYVKITHDQLDSMWPDFREAMDQKMLWERLSDPD